MHLLEFWILLESRLWTQEGATASTFEGTTNLFHFFVSPKNGVNLLQKTRNRDFPKNGVKWNKNGVKWSKMEIAVRTHISESKKRGSSIPLSKLVRQEGRKMKALHINFPKIRFFNSTSPLLGTLFWQKLQNPRSKKRTLLLSPLLPRRSILVFRRHM